MKYDFDAPVERGGTYSSKWKTSGEELPMWVADMDFKVAPEILEALQKRLDNGVFWLFVRAAGVERGRLLVVEQASRRQI